MNRILSIGFAICTFFCLSNVQNIEAQQVNLPQPSPAASTMYTIGTTEFKVEYSSPGVKGRTIWGDLVPYNEVWRTGANASTKISFSNDVSINNVKVPKGTYALYTIPSETDWTVIINKNTDHWGADGYDESEDIVRLKTTPKSMDNSSERMLFSIAPKNTRSDIGEVCLTWGKLSVSFDVQVDVDGAVQKQLEAARSGWRTIMQIASYHRDKGEYKKALMLINEAAEMEDYYYVLYLKSMILADMKNYKEAVATAEKALEVGATHKEPFLERFMNYKERIVESLEEWKKM